MTRQGHRSTLPLNNTSRALHLGEAILYILFFTAIPPPSNLNISFVRQTLVVPFSYPLVVVIDLHLFGGM